MNWYEKSLRHQWKSRAVGMVMIFFGAALAYFLVPFREAWLGQRYRIHPMIICVSVLFVYHGLILIVTGRNSHQFVVSRHGQSPTSLQKKTMGVCFMVGITLALGFGQIVTFLRTNLVE